MIYTKHNTYSNGRINSDDDDDDDDHDHDHDHDHDDQIRSYWQKKKVLWQLWQPMWRQCGGNVVVVITSSS